MSNWFRFLAEPMAQALVAIAHALGDNAGLAIIVFTIGIKVLLIPLTLKQLHSAKAMQELQPELQELQRKYKGDKQAATQATMDLYKEKGVNPAAGCLPLLVQLPVLYGLYGALFALGNPNDSLYSTLFAAPFLWLNGHVVNAGTELTGLAAPDPWHILPIVCVVTQWIQQRMMQTNKASDPQQAAMQSMMQFMPLMIGVFAWNLAAGLPLYWAVSTIFSAVQQYFITGWGKLFEVPTLGGFGGLLGGPSQNGRSPRAAKQPRPGARSAQPKPAAPNREATANRGRRRRGR